VETYIRKKSYEKCPRKLIIWFAGASVPSKSSMCDSCRRSLPTSTLKFCIIRGSVRPLKLAVRLSSVLN
jgi:hypothetical protein